MQIKTKNIMTLEEKTDEVLNWTKQMNSLNIKGYLNDWVDHYCNISTEIQILWYKTTGRIPQPHNGGYWMTYENWREIKKRILKL